MKYNIRHGESGKKKSKEYIAWCNIISRCLNTKNKAYKDYGGRGITICEEWRNSYEAFLADIGVAPNKSLSIDRINNNGNYEPGNCRWATRLEQIRNRRKAAAALIMYRGEELSLVNWCKRLTITYSIVRKHLDQGMAFDEIVKNYHKLLTFKRLNRAEIFVIKAFIDEGIHPRVIAKELSIAPYSIWRIARIMTPKNIAA